MGKKLFSMSKKNKEKKVPMKGNSEARIKKKEHLEY